jgi:hypothetical protein
MQPNVKGDQKNSKNLRERRKKYILGTVLCSTVKKYLNIYNLLLFLFDKCQEEQKKP